MFDDIAIFIPYNDEVKISEGYYSLREYKNSPEAIQYIADMLE